MPRYFLSSHYHTARQSSKNDICAASDSSSGSKQQRLHETMKFASVLVLSGYETTRLRIWVEASLEEARGSMLVNHCCHSGRVDDDSKDALKPKAWNEQEQM